MSYLDKLLNLEHRSIEVSRSIHGNIIVHYRNAYIDDGCCLIGVSGRGITIDVACEDYYRQISGKTLVFDPCTEHRSVVHVL